MRQNRLLVTDVQKQKNAAAQRVLPDGQHQHLAASTNAPCPSY